MFEAALERVAWVDPVTGRDIEAGYRSASKP